MDEVRTAPQQSEAPRKQIEGKAPSPPERPKGLLEARIAREISAGLRRRIGKSSDYDALYSRILELRDEQRKITLNPAQKTESGITHESKKRVIGGKQPVKTETDHIPKPDEVQPASAEAETQERKRNPLVERMMRILQRGGNTRQLEVLTHKQAATSEQGEQKPLDIERFKQVYLAIDGLWLNRVDRNSELFKQQVWFISSNRDVLVQALQEKQLAHETIEAIQTMFRLDHIFLKSAATEAIQKNLPRLQEYLNDPYFNDYHREGMIQAVANVTLIGNETQQQQANDFIEAAIPVITRGVEGAVGYQDILKVLLIKNMPIAPELAAKFIQNPERSMYSKAEVLTDLLYSQSSEFQLQAKKQLQEMLSNITNREVSEAEVRRFSQAWQESAESDEDGQKAVEDITRNFKRNLLDIKDLEKEEPGITKVLESEFGIRDFSRYSFEALLKQFRERNNRIPYIVVATARYDHNDAFSFSSNGEALRQLINDLDGKYGVRFIEAGTKLELLGRLSILNKRYGGEQKIAGMVVRAHGEKDEMVFGEYADVLKTSDVQKHGNEAVANLFEPSAPFAFISCSTGMAEGIAQGTAKTLGVNVTAPEIPTNISAITPVFKDGKLIDLTPQFYGEGSARAYIGRRKETSEDPGNPADISASEAAEAMLPYVEAKVNTIGERQPEENAAEAFQERITPQTALAYALELNPQADFTRGVYTELHVGQDGRIYVIPEIAHSSSHMASVEGYHSMFEAGKLNPEQLGTIQRQYFKRLPFDTQTLIAKGRLMRADNGELQLALYPHVRTETYHAIKGGESGIDPKTAFLVDVTAEKEELGIAQIYDAESKQGLEVHIEKDTIPAVKSDVVYTKVPEQTEDQSLAIPIHSGFARRMYYSEKMLERDVASTSGKTLVVSPFVEYDIVEANARTHQEAISKAFPGATVDTIKQLTSKTDPITIGGTRYDVQARHTLDERDKNIQINLIINGQEHMEDYGRFQNFEFTVFSTYLQTLMEQNKTDGYTVTCATTYDQQQGKPKMRRAKAPVASLTSDQEQANIFLFEQLAARGEL